MTKTVVVDGAGLLHPICCATLVVTFFVVFVLQFEVVVDDVNEDDVKDRGVVVKMVDQDETNDVDDVANLRWAPASRCHR